MRGDKRRAEAADIGLALAADVEKARVEATATARPVKMKSSRKRACSRSLRIAERPEDEALNGAQGLFADRQHDDAGDEEGRAQVDEREQREFRPGGSGLRGALMRRARSRRPSGGRSPPRSSPPGTARRRSRRRHDEDPVREPQDLVEFDGDDEHRLAGVALELDDALVDEFDRADVDAAGRLADESTDGLQSISRARTSFCWLPPEKAVLRRGGLRRPHVERGHLGIAVRRRWPCGCRRAPC